MHENDPVVYVTAITEWFESMGGLGPALKPTKEQIPAKRIPKPAPPIEKPAEEKSSEEMAALSLADDAEKPTNGDHAADAGGCHVDGVWGLSVQTPAGKQQVQLTITTSRTSLSGHLKGNGGTGEENKIEEGKVEGSVITFRATIKIPVKVKVTYKATIDGDSLTGEAKTAMLPAISFTGVRVP